MRHHAHMIFLQFLLLCAASGIVLSQPQDSIKVIVGEKAGLEKTAPHGTEHYLPAVMLNNERFLGVDGLCRLVSLESSFNTATKKLEIKFPGGQLRLTEGSPFVIVNNNSTRRQNIEQMPASAIVISRVLYAPAKSFLALFNLFSPQAVALDTAKFAPTFDITGLSSEKMKNGYLLRIRTARRLSDVDRFLRNSVWLYVTVSNATADTARLNKMMPFGIVRELITVQSPTSVQLAFFLDKKIADAEIIQDASSSDILVALRPPEPDSSKPVISTARLGGLSTLADTSEKIAEEKRTPATSDSSKISAAQQRNSRNEKAPSSEKETAAMDTILHAADTSTAIQAEHKRENDTAPLLTKNEEKKLLDSESPESVAAKKENTPRAIEAPKKILPKETHVQEKKEHQKLLAQLEQQRNRWKLDVVVLDPGHGGYDPGTIGTIGTREKDITLGIALKLGKLIKERMPDVRVVYTRKTDRFVELYRRGQIANENQGKLFISIHCNALERKPSSVNGFEIYLLRPGKTEDAIKVAQKENAVVRLEQDYQDRYQDITEENFIILTMAQSAYIHNSETFAGFLQEEMEKHMHAESRGVKQAGFYVLVGASMPNVLIETGYLSNPHDEKFLRSPKGQQIVAESIFRALERYKNSYEETLSE